MKIFLLPVRLHINLWNSFNMICYVSVTQELQASHDFLSLSTAVDGDNCHSISRSSLEIPNVIS